MVKPFRQRLPGKSRLRYDLLYVVCNVKLYLLTHSIVSHFSSAHVQLAFFCSVFKRTLNHHIVGLSQAH